MLRYHINGFSGYNIQYSPFFDNKLAVASASNYGLVGNGKLVILDILPDGTIKESNSFLTQDCLFDVAWNESHESQCLVAQGDGSLRLFDINLQKYPIAIFKEHKKEVLSCNWNLINKNLFLSSSWDGDVKVWSTARQASLITLSPIHTDPTAIVNTKSNINPSLNNVSQPILHPRSTAIRQPVTSASMQGNDNKNCIYQAQFSPHDPNIVACCSGTSYLTLFDLRQPTPNVQRGILTQSGYETLTLDFNKYRSHIIATSGVDKAIKMWDMRFIPSTFSPQSTSTTPILSRRQQEPINEIINAHDLAVKTIKWSPHHSNLMVSTSYDMTCKTWMDISYQNGTSNGRTNSLDPQRRNGCLAIMDKHSEFAFGVDWSLWGQPGFIASTGWDGNVFIWNTLR
ncbi:Pex7p NDAI_0J01040 [Naumovozyma dairenensis CBS 421]|uniref:Peroxin-7 n=1 Tax=Naumovozyma dairenensis (strain ATCC 10597 / BCRC 20456 / CBS 421 / NBRC 0211 / NRRL Y-12639) TaxID=1071378 RepID=G0WGR8_NAUDC|nr:hypothetical protein NDAI_0J01040 [Naumovozyma dairenensis CBS 421]CCD26996.1 hypothetical protein NDAI_0J01040 [Naumovozyma dairenensis CBS 421]